MTNEELEKEVIRLSRRVTELEWRLHIMTVAADINADLATLNRQSLQSELDRLKPIANQYVQSESYRMLRTAGLRK